MAEIIPFEKNSLGFSHVICGVCVANSFHVKTIEIKEVEMFYSIICADCGNEIFCNLQPVFQAKV
jgi:hypothetical protein